MLFAARSPDSRPAAWGFGLHCSGSVVTWSLLALFLAGTGCQRKAPETPENEVRDRLLSEKKVLEVRLSDLQAERDRLRAELARGAACQKAGDEPRSPAAPAEEGELPVVKLEPSAEAAEASPPSSASAEGKAPEEVRPVLFVRGDEEGQILTSDEADAALAQEAKSGAKGRPKPQRPPTKAAP